MIIEKVKSIDSLPTDIETKVWEKKKEEFFDVFINEGYLYLAAGLGQRNTSGYDINIKKINIRNMEEWEVILDKKTPEKGKVLSQVVTYPIIIGKVMIKDKKIPKKIIFQNKNGKIIKKINLDIQSQE